MFNHRDNWLEKQQLKKDIDEVAKLLNDYRNARTAVETAAIDDRARQKIMELQLKDVLIHAKTAPKPGETGIPWPQVSSMALRGLLNNIQEYLEAKLIAKNMES